MTHRQKANNSVRVPFTKGHKHYNLACSSHSNMFNSQATLPKEPILASMGISPLRQRPQKNKQNHSLFSDSQSAKFMRKMGQRERLLIQQSKENIPDNFESPLLVQPNKTWKKSITTQKNRLFTDPQPEIYNKYLQKLAGEPHCFSKKMSQLNIGSGCFHIEDISFKNLIQNRCKTPVVGSNRTKCTPSSRTSQHSKNADLFHNMFKKHEEQSAPIESHRGENYCVTYCCNNDGKEAKYRVINQDQLQKDLVYCSRCTIALVQQGFILEEFQSVKKSKNGNSDVLNRRKEILQDYLAQLTSLHKEDLRKIKTYYNQIIQIVKSFLAQDICSLQKYYEQVKNSYRESIEAIVQFQNIEGHQNEDKFCSAQQIKQQGYEHEKHLYPYVKISNEFLDTFAETFKNYRPHLAIELCKKEQQTSKESNMIDPVDIHHALRFSFQKLASAIKNQTSGLSQCQSNPQKVEEQEQIEDELQYSNSELLSDNHTAFRDLFPQQEEKSRLKGNIRSPTFKNI